MDRRWLPAVVGGALLVAGCAASDPVDAWRDAVTRSVTNDGHGDLGSLHRVASVGSIYDPRPAQVRIGERGIPGPRGLCDAWGLLLGVRQAQGRSWYVFVLGVSRRASPRSAGDIPADTVEDVRIAAVSSRDGSGRAGAGGLQWIFSEPDGEALGRYLAARQASPPGAAMRMVFPRPYDTFVLTSDEDTFTVTERHSGATWRVRINGPAEADRPE